MACRGQVQERRPAAAALSDAIGHPVSTTGPTDGTYADKGEGWSFVRGVCISAPRHQREAEADGWNEPFIGDNVEEFV